MSVQNSPRDKPFVTFNAHVRSLAAVIPFVNDERRPLGKILAAFVAGVLPLAGMSYMMGSQEAHGRETFAANLAGEGLLARVNSPVYLHAG